MSPSAVSPRGHKLIVIFDVFVFLGLILFLCTLLPAIFSRAVQRSVAWYSLMTAWVVYSVSYGLLIGRQEGPEPPVGLCLMQTLLIYAVPALAATGMLCYYIEFFLVIFSFRSGKPVQPSSARVFWLVVTPWIVFLAVIVEVILLVYPGGRLPLVERAVTGFYCHLGDGLPNQVSASIVCLCMAILLPLEGYTGFLMFKNWDVFKTLSKTDRQIFVTVYLRLILCTLAAILAFTLSMLALAPGSPDAPTLVYPTLPIFIAFAFGTQKDLLRAWLFWRPPKPYGSLIFNNGTGRGTGVVFTSHIQTSIGVTSTFPSGVAGTHRHQQQEEIKRETTVEQHSVVEMKNSSAQVEGV